MSDAAENPGPNPFSTGRPKLTPEETTRRIGGGIKLVRDSDDPRAVSEHEQLRPAKASYADGTPINIPDPSPPRECGYVQVPGPGDSVVRNNTIVPEGVARFFDAHKALERAGDVRYREERAAADAQLRWLEIIAKHLEDLTVNLEAIHELLSAASRQEANGG